MMSISCERASDCQDLKISLADGIEICLIRHGSW